MALTFSQAMKHVIDLCPISRVKGSLQLLRKVRRKAHFCSLRPQLNWHMSYKLFVCECCECASVVCYLDTVMMMSSYSDAVVIRHPQPGAVAVCILTLISLQLAANTALSIWVAIVTQQIFLLHHN